MYTIIPCRFGVGAGVIGAIALAMAFAAPEVAHAQDQEVFVGGPAGMATVLREEVFPIVEDACNVSILYEGSRSLVNLEKLRANREQPEMSVVLMDDPVLAIAEKEDLIERITPDRVPNMKKVVSGAIVREGIWANYAQPVAGIAYNTEELPNGIDSWEEVWDPKFEGRVVIPSVQNTEGIWMLIVAAHLETGKPLQEAQYDTDAAFKKLAELKPNLLTIYTNAPQALNLVEQGEAWIIPGQFSSYTLLRKDQGASIDLAVPKEAGFAMPSGIAKIKGAPAPEGADCVINEFLGPDAQRVVSTRFFSAPTNPETDVPPELALRHDLFVPDWQFFAQNREQLIERWVREMGQ